VTREEQANEIKRYAITGLFKVKRRVGPSLATQKGSKSIGVLICESNVLGSKPVTFDVLHDSPGQTLLNPLKFKGFARDKSRTARVFRHKDNLGGILVASTRLNLLEAITNVSRRRIKICVKRIDGGDTFINMSKPILVPESFSSGDDAGTVPGYDVSWIEERKHSFKEYFRFACYLDHVTFTGW
jgi:hypothetical protein